MKEIQARGKQGGIILVDDDIYELLNGTPIYINTRGYAQIINKTRETIKTVRLHRWVLNAPKGKEVDHINGNKLDNRRENLRLVTSSQNNQARRIVMGNTSKYRGVSYHHREKRWVAEIYSNNKRHCAGYFKTELEAVEARDRLAKELHGVYAQLNFPE